MQLYSGIISNSIVEQLKVLLGKNLYVIYSPGIKVSNDHIQGESFSIPIYGEDWQNILKWMNFRNQTVNSTDRQFFNHIDLSISDKPHNINVKEEVGKKYLVYPYSSYLIKMESGWEIESISIFRKEEKFISFQHSFDYGIIFSLPNKREICFYSEEVSDNIITLSESISLIEEVKSKGFKIIEIK